MSKRKSEDSFHKAKLTKRTNSQEQPEQELFEQVSRFFIQCSKNRKLIDLDR